jgi:hypothetical protein
MFYSLKRTIICKSIDKRVKQHPFDFQFAESYSIEGEEDPLINNSYYFSAHDENMSFFARLGKRVNVDETWFALYFEGKLYSLKQEFFPNGSSPILVEKIGENWAVSYQGKLNENDETAFHATFIAHQKPIDFTSNMPAERMATGIANEKWNKAFFEQLQNVSGQCHYEQEGVLEGQMTLNGKTMDFHLPCVRDHSFGKRDWNYMNNHLWLMAVSPSRQFNYSLVSYPVMSVLEVGNYRDEAGMHYLMQADLDFQQINQGTVPRELSFHVQLDNSQSIHVAAKVLAGVTYHFQEGQYILHENIAEFSIDGKACRGILEIGFNGNRSRWFNQRKLENIKR